VAEQLFSSEGNTSPEEKHSRGPSPWHVSKVAAGTWEDSEQGDTEQPPKAAQVQNPQARLRSQVKGTPPESSQIRS